MELVLYQDKPRWDLWVKVLIAFAPLLTLVLGFIFLLDYLGYIETGEPKSEVMIATIVLFAVTAFTLLLYWAVFPKRFIVLQDRLRLKCGAFSFQVPFKDIKEVKATEGIMFMGWSFVTSLKSQIEIARKMGMNVRISPSNRELFLKYLSLALKDWERAQQ
jgi:hypothetical protein